MKTADLVAQLKAQIEPLADGIYGPRYRASAKLTDGTCLPCVVFQSRGQVVKLALRRFDETLKQSKPSYREVVASFVASGSRVAEWDIASIEPSPFAWDLSLLRRIEGDTFMGWTAFVVEMHDGAFFSMGTSFHFEFFDLPDGYLPRDIKNIHSGKVYSEASGLQAASPEVVRTNIYQAKPFFTCYIDGLEPWSQRLPANVRQPPTPDIPLSTRSGRLGALVFPDIAPGVAGRPAHEDCKAIK